MRYFYFILMPVQLLLVAIGLVEFSRMQAVVNLVILAFLTLYFMLKPQWQISHGDAKIAVSDADADTIRGMLRDALLQHEEQRSPAAWSGDDSLDDIDNAVRAVNSVTNLPFLLIIAQETNRRPVLKDDGDSILAGERVAFECSTATSGLSRAEAVQLLQSSAKFILENEGEDVAVCEHGHSQHPDQAGPWSN